MSEAAVLGSKLYDDLFMIQHGLRRANAVAIKRIVKCNM